MVACEALLSRRISATAWYCFFVILWWLNDKVTHKAYHVRIKYASNLILIDCLIVLCYNGTTI